MGIKQRKWAEERASQKAEDQKLAEKIRAENPPPEQVDINYVKDALDVLIKKQFPKFVVKVTDKIHQNKGSDGIIYTPNVSEHQFDIKVKEGDTGQVIDFLRRAVEGSEPLHGDYENNIISIVGKPKDMADIITDRNELSSPRTPPPTRTR